MAYDDACNNFLLFNRENHFRFANGILSLEKLVNLDRAIISDNG